MDTETVITETEQVEDPFAGIVGQDPSMRELFSMVRSVAESPVTILIDGESGTGKRVIAQAIHRADPKRCNRPFVEISCGALPETLLESELFGHVKGAFTGAVRDTQGRFEIAHGGTILLDEIDAFSLALQVKLLRVVEQKIFERVGETRVRQVNVRIIAATNRTLANLVSQGTFREDLFYRLNVVTLHLPPLRERRTDLPLLTHVLLQRSALVMGKKVTGISDEAMQILRRYHWPGNVRELEHVIDRAVIFSRHAELTVEDLPEELRRPSARGTREHGEAFIRSMTPFAPDSLILKDAMRLPEREFILKVLTESRWNRSRAARRLGIHRSTLYHKLRKLGIHTLAQ